MVIWESNATALDEIGVSAYKPARKFDPIAEMDGCAFRSGQRRESGVTGGTLMRRWMVVVLLLLVIGCGRAFYRRQADRDSYAILEERNGDPQWHVPYFSLNPNPESRLYDPTDPDYPAMPPDDPAAYQYMLRANGMRNYRRWHKDGDILSVEDPAWRDFLKLDDKGVLVLNMNRAVELAWLNSRDYQAALETLYQQALTLTFVRFDFAIHWFAGNGTVFTHFGSDGDETNTLTTTTTAGFTKNLAAGGQILANFVNSFIFQFAGPDMTLMTSNLTVSLFQPLLQMAGRRFRMEPLTQSERNVLYAVRDFARFRKQLYVNITTGGRGFLPLLNQVQSIRNQEGNLASTEQNLRMTEALYETQQASTVQVDQSYLAVQSARQALIAARATLETSMDNYKIFLGLPPDIPIRLDDSLLAPFQLTDPVLDKLKDETDAFLKEFQQMTEAPSLVKLQAGFEKLKENQSQTRKLLDEIEKEIQQWKQQPADPEQGKEEAERTRALQKDLANYLQEDRDSVRDLDKDIAKDQAALQEAKRVQSWNDLLALIRLQKVIFTDLYILQTRVRVYLIRLTPVTIKLDAGVAYAREHRLDLMNEEARVVDAWRQIAVTANLLRSQLNITGAANLAAPPLSLNPVGFAASANSYSVGIQFNAPLNREAERNAYRQSLINYQQLRRNYMALDDSIVESIRVDLRNLQTDRANFEISRRSLGSAARGVEGAEQQLRLGVGDATATTKAVLDAYQNLLTAKNSLIGNWVSYEADRNQLLLDMEALQLDEREVTANDADNQPAESSIGFKSGSPGANATGLASDAGWLAPCQANP
ncbi:MAG TPA: TolC family protein [Gemmataceae bacterium]|jgi:outer membrane protein TolC|nr:TolC family protein [Gemmataceae bacterium]